MTAKKAPNQSVKETCARVLNTLKMGEEKIRHDVVREAIRTYLEKNPSLGMNKTLACGYAGITVGRLATLCGRVIPSPFDTTEETTVEAFDKWWLDVEAYLETLKIEWRKKFPVEDYPDKKYPQVTDYDPDAFWMKGLRALGRDGKARHIYEVSDHGNLIEGMAAILAAAGIKDPDAQDEIIAHLNDQAHARGAKKTFNRFVSMTLDEALQQPWADPAARAAWSALRRASLIARRDDLDKRMRALDLADLHATTPDVDHPAPPSQDACPLCGKTAHLGPCRL